MHILEISCTFIAQIEIMIQREIEQLVGLDSKTVEKYIDVLEQSYIVFRLSSYARNLRNEPKQSKKIYFPSHFT